MQTADAISSGELPLEVEAQLRDALREHGLPDEALAARMAASLAPHVSLDVLRDEDTVEALIKGAITMLSMRTGLLQGLVDGTVQVEGNECPGEVAQLWELQEERQEAFAERLSQKVNMPMAIVRAIVSCLGEICQKCVPAGALELALFEGRVSEVEEHLAELVMERLGGKFVSPEETLPAVRVAVNCLLQYVLKRLSGAPAGRRLRDAVSGAAAGSGGGPSGAEGERGGGGEPPGGKPPSNEPPSGSEPPAESGSGMPRWAQLVLVGLLFASLVATVLALARRRAQREASEAEEVKQPRVQVLRNDLYIGISVAVILEVLLLLFKHFRVVARLRLLLGLDDGGPEGAPESWDVYPEIALVADTSKRGLGGTFREHLPQEIAFGLSLFSAGVVAMAVWRRRRDFRAGGSHLPPEITPFAFLADLRPWLLTSGLPRETAKTLAATALFAHSIVSQTALSSAGRMNRPCALVICEPEGLARVAAIRQEASSSITRYDVPRLTIWQLCDWQKLQDCLVHNGDCLLLRPNGSLHAVMQQSGRQTAETWKECSVRAGATAVLLDEPDTNLGASVAVLGGSTVWQSGRVVPVPPPTQRPGQYRPPAHMMVAAALHSVDEFVVGGS